MLSRAHASDPFDRLAPMPGYQTAPVERAFDWRERLSMVRAGTWYVVAFRSQRRAGADEELLLAHDELALGAAERLGGLLVYFRGDLDDARRCLSVCVWDHRHRARMSSSTLEHHRAAELTNEMYVSYRVERHLLRRVPGDADPRWIRLDRRASSEPAMSPADIWGDA